MNSNHPEVEFVHYFPGYLLSPSSSTERTSFGGEIILSVFSQVTCHPSLRSPHTPASLPTPHSPHPSPHNCMEEGPVSNSVSSWWQVEVQPLQASLSTNRKSSSREHQGAPLTLLWDPHQGLPQPLTLLSCAQPLVQNFKQTLYL